LINFKAFFMPFVYVIDSLADKTSYTGIALNYNNRLKEHNNGKNRFTKGHMPWKIIYTEEHPDWQSARTREKYLKSAAGKRWLEKYLATDGGDTSSLPA
jgi:putative endonuclease